MNYSYIGRLRQLTKNGKRTLEGAYLMLADELCRAKSDEKFSRKLNELLAAYDELST